jgi:hypothetical protein
MVFLIQMNKINTIKTKTKQTNKNLKRRNDLNVHKIWKKPEYPEKTTDLSQTLSHNVVSSTPRHEQGLNSQL